MEMGFTVLVAKRCGSGSLELNYGSREREAAFIDGGASQKSTLENWYKSMVVTTDGLSSVPDRVV